MATDAASIALALAAIRLAARPATGTITFGLGRAEILSSQVNGAGLFVLAGVIGFEAVRRLFDPPDVEGGLVIAVGLLGAAVNVAAAWAMSRAERKSLNVEGARQHVLTDLYASLAAATAGAVVLLLGFLEADPIAALVVCALMFRSGWACRSDLVGDVLQGSSAHRWKVCDRRARRGGDLIAERSIGRLSRRGGSRFSPQAAIASTRMARRISEKRRTDGRGRAYYAS